MNPLLQRKSEGKLKNLLELMYFWWTDKIIDNKEETVYVWICIVGTEKPHNTNRGTVDSIGMDKSKPLYIKFLLPQKITLFIMNNI